MHQHVEPSHLETEPLGQLNPTLHRSSRNLLTRFSTGYCVDQVKQQCKPHRVQVQFGVGRTERVTFGQFGYLLGDLVLPALVGRSTLGIHVNGHRVTVAVHLQLGQFTEQGPHLCIKTIGNALCDKAGREQRRLRPQKSLHQAVFVVGGGECAFEHGRLNRARNTHRGMFGVPFGADPIIHKRLTVPCLQPLGFVRFAAAVLVEGPEPPRQLVPAHAHALRPMLQDVDELLHSRILGPVADADRFFRFAGGLIFAFGGCSVFLQLLLVFFLLRLEVIVGFGFQFQQEFDPSAPAMRLGRPGGSDRRSPDDARLLPVEPTYEPLHSSVADRTAHGTQQR